MKNYFLLFSLLFFTASLTGQPVQRMIKVSIVPNSKDWTLKLGDKAKFNVSVTQNGIPIENADISYQLSYDMLKPFKDEKTILKDGQIVIDAGTMKQPGFLRCRVFALIDGERYEGRGTVGYNPSEIKPTTQMPDDFNEFWENAKAENAKIPMDTKLILLPKECTEKVNVYELNIQNFRKDGRIYGVLCVPKAPGKYPAMLRVPGAGVRSYKGDILNAEKGYITLSIGIHGIPVAMDEIVYNNLRYGALDGYQFANWDNKDKVYYKKVYMGCVRAIDYIFSMPEFDGKNMITYGGSQGGALSIITATLDRRVTAAISFYPAMSDMNGYLYNRAGGWPHMFRDATDSPSTLKEKEKTAQYYDVVNFARLINVPVFFAYGYNDMVCPPTTSSAVYNVISSPKNLLVLPEIEHYTFPEMWTKVWNWVDTIIK